MINHLTGAPPAFLFHHESVDRQEGLLCKCFIRNSYIVTLMFTTNASRALHHTTVSAQRKSPIRSTGIRMLTCAWVLGNAALLTCADAACV